MSKCAAMLHHFSRQNPFLWPKQGQQTGLGPAFPFVTRRIGILLPASGTLPAPGAARGPFVSVRAADETGQTYLFGGPSPGNPSVPSNATCTSSPRRTAPSTGKHSLLLFCLAVRTAYCTADPTFVGAGNCAAPGSIGEHEDEDRSASEAAMDSTIHMAPLWASMVAFRQLLTIESRLLFCPQKSS